MNEMSQWEKHLLSWTPRRPSARLERRLFAATPTLAEALPPFRFGWLAPATAVLALMCVLFTQRYLANCSPSAAASPMVAMILSNQSAPAYLLTRFQPEQNNLPVRASCSASSRAASFGIPSLSPSRATGRP
jgi:hypothetical protein